MTGNIAGLLHFICRTLDLLNKDEGAHIHLDENSDFGRLRDQYGLFEAIGMIFGVKNSIEQISNAETKRDNLNDIQTGGTILGFVSPLAGEAFSVIQHIPKNNLPSGTPGETPSSTYGFKNVIKAFNQSAGT